jgi:hypothetical protein
VSISLQHKEGIKPSESIASDLDLDHLQAFKAQLCNKIPRMNEAFQWLEAIRDPELHESELGVQCPDYGILSDFIVGVAMTCSTAFAKTAETPQARCRQVGRRKGEQAGKS